jgi:hypothetical protein
MRKSVLVSACFSNLPAAHAWQHATGQGSTLAIAIKRAVDSLFRLPHVRGRRVREVRLSIAVQPVKGES